MDDFLLVVDKVSGLLSVPGRGEHKRDSVVVRVQQRYPEALVVHRLDMETSGVLLLARSRKMQRELSLLFQQRKIEKRYLALVTGKLPKYSGTIDKPLAADWPRRPRQKVDFTHGKPSITHYKVLQYHRNDNTSRLELRPITGRSHQLRVHLQSIGHPIVGDKLYANDHAHASRLMLHALSLAFEHPATKQRLRLQCPAGF